MNNDQFEKYQFIAKNTDLNLYNYGCLLIGCRHQKNVLWW